MLGLTYLYSISLVLNYIGLLALRRHHPPRAQLAHATATHTGQASLSHSHTGPLWLTQVFFFELSANGRRREKNSLLVNSYWYLSITIACALRSSEHMSR